MGFLRKRRATIAPESMDSKAREAALEQARALYHGHAVEVKKLEPGEIPIPKRADQ